MRRTSRRSLPASLFWQRESCADSPHAHSAARGGSFGPPSSGATCTHVPADLTQPRMRTFAPEVGGIGVYLQGSAHPRLCVDQKDRREGMRVVEPATNGSFGSPRPRVERGGRAMSNPRSTQRRSVGRLRAVTCALAVAVAAVVTSGTIPAQAAPPEQAERRFEVMTYNVYLGANLQPLFGISDPEELIRRATAVFA